MDETRKITSSEGNLEERVMDILDSLGLESEGLQSNVSAHFAEYSKVFGTKDGVLGALVYWLAPVVGRRRTQKQIADSLNISETTIRNYYIKVKEHYVNNLKEV